MAAAGVWKAALAPEAHKVGAELLALGDDMVEVARPDVVLNLVHRGRDRGHRHNVVQMLGAVVRHPDGARLAAVVNLRPPARTNG